MTRTHRILLWTQLRLIDSRYYSTSSTNLYFKLINRISTVKCVLVVLMRSRFCDLKFHSAGEWLVKAHWYYYSISPSLRGLLGRRGDSESRLPLLPVTVVACRRRRPPARDGDRPSHGDMQASGARRQVATSDCRVTAPYPDSAPGGNFKSSSGYRDCRAAVWQP